GTDHRVVAGQGSGDVLDALAHVETDLVGTDRHGVTAELHHRHLHRVAGAGGRLLEHERRAPALENPWSRARDSQGEHLTDLCGAQVVDVEQVPHSEFSRILASRVTASSISSSVMSRDGAN